MRELIYVARLRVSIISDVAMKGHLLSSTENGLATKTFSEDTSDGPNINYTQTLTFLRLFMAKTY